VLFGAHCHEATHRFESLIDRLSSRLGPEAVLRPELTADPVPERAVAYVPLLQAGKRKPRTPPAHRPLVLHSPPVSLTAISVVPDGPPVSFQFGGRLNKVVSWWGPERIESGWWRGRSTRRDYYRVESDSGQRYWLYRRLADGKWFLHGEFA
jgi:protein ImuB